MVPADAAPVEQCAPAIFPHDVVEKIEVEILLRRAAAKNMAGHEVAAHRRATEAASADFLHTAAVVRERFPRSILPPAPGDRRAAPIFFVPSADDARCGGSAAFHQFREPDEGIRRRDDIILQEKYKWCAAGAGEAIVDARDGMTDGIERIGTELVRETRGADTIVEKLRRCVTAARQPFLRRGL